MPVKNIDITVDFTRPGVVNTQKELRYGDENNLRIAVTDGGNQVSLSSLGITTVDLVVSRLTGTPIDVVGSIVDEKAVFTLDGASLSVPGYTKATVQFYGADGSRVSTADFSFKSLADPSINAVGDSTEQTIIQQVLVNGPQVIDEAEAATIAANDKIVELDAVIVENTQDYLEPVNAFSDLATAYPSPSNGNKVYLKSTGETVRYNGTQWIVTHENDPTAIGYISAQLDDKASKQELLTTVGNISEGTPLFAPNVAGMTDVTRNYVNTTDGFLYTHNGTNFVTTGVQYQSTGLADGEVTEQKTSFINVLATENIYDKRNLTPNTNINPTTGATSSFTGYSANLDYRPILPNQRYRKRYGGNIAFYDENFVFISGLGSAAAGDFTTPNLTAFYRTTTMDSQIESQMIVAGDTLPSTYIPFNSYELKSDIAVAPLSVSPLKSLIWNAIGDSLTNTTYGKPYHQYLAETIGMTSRNYGVNGTTIAVRAGFTNSMLERYPTMDNNADIITLFGGRNDFSQGVPLGVMTDRVDNTLYGACHLLMSGLIEKYPGKKIGVILPMQRDTDTSSMLNYVNAIKEVAEYYSLPVLDLYRHSGLTPKITSIKDAYMPDGLHPNSAGHEIIARRIKAFIESL